MIALFQNSKSGSRIGYALIDAVMCLLLTACAFAQSFTQPKVKDEVLVDSPRGAVFLQKAEDGWFKTAHPLAVSPAMIASVLRGVQVKAPAGTAEGGPVFSIEDTEFLSALISSALSKADKSQVVGFRVIRGTDAGNETTGGILYFQGRLLHLTFTHYRAQQEQSGKAGTSLRLVPNPTGLDTRQVGFVPETVQRSSRHEQPDVITTPPLASLVIDYEELFPGAIVQPAQAQAHPVQLDQATVIQRGGRSVPSRSDGVRSQDMEGVPAGAIGTTQETVKDHATELESLKEEVRILQRRLLELEGNTPRTKEP